jgi:serine/threonine protein kinase
MRTAASAIFQSETRLRWHRRVCPFRNFTTFSRKYKVEAIMSSPSSSTLNLCRECGTPLSPAAPDGFCPSCLLEGALRLGVSTTLDPEAGAVATSVEEVKARVGVYDLLEEIGRGGMGVVYRARQGSLNRILAVKMILSGQFAGRHEVLRFRGEAEMAAKLNHPNIVAVHESGDHEGQHYFSMDFVQGRSLAEIVRDGGPLPVRRAAVYAKTIAEAIHYAHQQGVLHRDLKPSNILIDAEDRPRITDFGLARHLRDDFGLTVTGQLLGSPNFMPPEQASGSSSAN